MFLFFFVFLFFFSGPQNTIASAREQSQTVIKHKCHEGNSSTHAPVQSCSGAAGHAGGEKNDGVYVSHCINNLNLNQRARATLCYGTRENREEKKQIFGPDIGTAFAILRTWAAYKCQLLFSFFIFFTFLYLDGECEFWCTYEYVRRGVRAVRKYFCQKRVFAFRVPYRIR